MTKHVFKVYFIVKKGEGEGGIKVELINKTINVISSCPLLVEWHDRFTTTFLSLSEDEVEYT